MPTSGILDNNSLIHFHLLEAAAIEHKVDDLGILVNHQGD